MNASSCTTLNAPYDIQDSSQPTSSVTLTRDESSSLTQIKYIGQTQAASDGSSLDMPPSSTMAAKGVHPHLENLKTKVRFRRM